VSGDGWRGSLGSIERGSEREGGDRDACWAGLSIDCDLPRRHHNILRTTSYHFYDLERESHDAGASNGTGQGGRGGAGQHGLSLSQAGSSGSALLEFGYLGITGRIYPAFGFDIDLFFFLTTIHWPFIGSRFYFQGWSLGQSGTP
jgi:hypothetical protein